MPLAFEYDPRKAEQNLRKHGIGLAEAITIFNDPFAQSFSDELDGDIEERWIALGVSSRQRLLFVSRQEDCGNVRIIGARSIFPSRNTKRSCALSCQACSPTS